VIKTDAAIVAELEQKAKAATATLEAERERLRRRLERGEYLDDRQTLNLMLAEAIHMQYRDLGAKSDGTLKRNEGEDDADLVRWARSERAKLERVLLGRDEEMWPGFGAVRQHQNLMGARRFLRETEFLVEEGQ
jgi:hypothetical protein